MKTFLLICSSVALLTACNSKKTTTVTTRDTVSAIQPEPLKAPVALARPVAKRSTVTSGTSSASHSSETMSSPSENTAKRNTGWSKTAKGAVIGGAIGAGTGAVVNKKNRAAGAVVGGVIGAGAGAIIGNEKDKRDGRH